MSSDKSTSLTPSRRRVQPDDGANEMTSLRIEFCDTWTDVPDDQPYVIGREADFVVDENPYLHRRFLELSAHDGMWWVSNVGQYLSATISDMPASVHAWLAPGAQMPVVFDVTVVRFAAGSTSYELALHLDAPPFHPAGFGGLASGTTTRGAVILNDEQRLLIVALAEPALRSPGTGTTGLPSSAVAAARLGWPITKFNRKLDNLCQKLKRAGVSGLHGDADQLASARRARLVQHALATRLISAADLPLLDAAAEQP
jgi:hypothetical protein